MDNRANAVLSTYRGLEIRAPKSVTFEMTGTEIDIERAINHARLCCMAIDYIAFLPGGTVIVVPRNSYGPRLPHMFQASMACQLELLDAKEAHQGDAHVG